MLPLVSIVTPTYNRRRFIPSLIRMVQQQTYPRDRLEWIVYDDGQEPVDDLLEAARTTLPKLRYIFSDEKMTLGEKRNRLNQEATGDIIVAMDDDDYYVPQRVSAAVETLQKSPTVDLAGSSKVYMYFTDTKQIYVIGPYFTNHATNGTIGARTLGKGIGTLGFGAVPLGKAFDITAALPAIPKILSRTLAGTAGGALAGSVMEEAPTVEEIGPRKLQAAKTGAITGAIITPALSGIGSLSKGAYDLVMRAKGKSVQEAIDALKNVVTKEADEARQFLTQKSYEAEKVARSEVSTARDITEARYATRSKLTKDLDSAKKETETSLKGLGNNRQSDENLGKFIQNSGKKNIEAIRATTTKEAIRDIKDPAFERARGRAASGDTLSTNPDSAPILKEIVSDIEQQIADVPGRFRGELEGRIDDIIGKKIPLSSNELRVEQLRESSIPGYIAQKFKREPLTLHQGAELCLLHMAAGFRHKQGIRLELHQHRCSCG